MYTLVFQKNEDDSPQFPLTEQLCTFLKQTKASGIIVFPGYLSRTKNSIEFMLKNFLINTEIIYFGIGNPCKVEKEKKLLSSNDSLKQHIKVLKRTFPKVNWLEIERNNQSDHSKMLVIFNLITKDTKISTPIKDEKSCDDFLSKIKIIGMVIGSSNFSKTTYYGKFDDVKNISKATKGETDLFMFWGEKDGQCNEYEENENFAKRIADSLYSEYEDTSQRQYEMILFENMTKVPEDYFKKILKNKLIKTVKELK